MGELPSVAQEDLAIVSLLPSLTEVVAELGLADRLVGITHECDYPPDVMRLGLEVVTTSYITGGTQKEIDDEVRASLAENHSLYALKEDVLGRLKPTHVLTQSLCDVCAVAFDQVERKCARLLASDPYQLLSVEPQSLEDVRQSIETVGAALGCKSEAIADAVGRFDAKLARVAGALPAPLAAGSASPKPRVALLEWFDPLFYGGHWIQEMIQLAGGEYTLASRGERSKVMTAEALAEYDADVIVLAPCGFSLDRCVRDAKSILFDEKAEAHGWWTNLRAVQHNRVYAADGNQFFSRPSPRLADGVMILAEIMHGSDFGQADHWIRLGA